MVNDKAYKNVKEQIGYCGLWCGSCAVGNGAISQLSRQLKQIVTGYGVKSWGPKDINYDDLITALSTLESKINCKGCLKGGGNDADESQGYQDLDQSEAPGTALKSFPYFASQSQLFHFLSVLLKTCMGVSLPLYEIASSR